MQLGFYVDTTRCVGCYTCTVACKNWNNLAPVAKATPGTAGPTWRRVISTETGKYPDVKIVKMSQGCMHCGKPACMAACPAGAISKRAADGIVLVDQAKCIGCKSCQAVCPFGAPQFGEDGKMQKCVLCFDRLAQKKQPACVTNCPAKALFAGPMDELSAMVAKKAAIQLVGATQPSMLITVK